MSLISESIKDEIEWVLTHYGPKSAEKRLMYQLDHIKDFIDEVELIEQILDDIKDRIPIIYHRITIEPNSKASKTTLEVCKDKHCDFPGPHTVSDHPQPQSDKDLKGRLRDLHEKLEIAAKTDIPYDLIGQDLRDVCEFMATFLYN